ncbi:MAG: heparinase II/III family protein [Clostridia bacterium]
MIRFTNEEIAKFRQKCQKDDSIVNKLKEQTTWVMENDILLPKEGIANWGLYYFCKECSVRLTFDITKPTEHVCPTCGKVYTGAPFDQSWWQFTLEIHFDGVYNLGLLYTLTGEKKYALKAKAILIEMANYYPDYQVHGDIPYNDPGKACAQTLNEAILLRQFAFGYDMTTDVFSDEEKYYVYKNLFKIGGEFLCEHRANQLHNHEVIINAAISVIGILFNNDDLIQFGVYKDYGLLYQLENAMLKDGLWFEGSIGYHFFAMQNFFAYEKFAIHTKYSNIHHENYQKMLECIIKLLQPNNEFPLINDIHARHICLDYYNLFDWPSKMFDSVLIRQVMNEITKKDVNINIERFFYGLDDYSVKADVGYIKHKDYHNEDGSGMTISHQEPKQYLMLKHGPYGGEHDHYDRLSLAYIYNDTFVSNDLGTTGYGALYHYEYFKNTGTHNTVVINEENHAPSKGSVNKYVKTDDFMYIDMQNQWCDGYVMPDSFVIKQWSDEDYKDVTMRRRIYKQAEFLLDVFTVDCPKDNQIDWVMHFDGEKTSQSTNEVIVENFSSKKPFKYFSKVSKIDKALNEVITYKTDDVLTDLYSYASFDDCFVAVGPGNPTDKDIAFIIQRKQGKQAIFVNLLASRLENEPTKVSDVNFEIINQEVVCSLKVNGNNVCIRTDEF